MKAKRMLLALDALLIAILACNLPSPQNPARSSNDQADVAIESSDTPTFTATPEFTATPTLTPTITLTPTPSVPQLTVSTATNCRTGPGVVYDLLYTLQPGQVAQIVGADLPDNYWIIKNPAGGICWLWGQYALVSGNTAILPAYPIPPSPTPAMPAAPTHLNVGVSCSHSGPLLPFTVNADLSWQDNAVNENGYYVFRNGDLLATLGPDSTSFSDTTSLAAIYRLGAPKPSITYTVQAFNDTGKSKKVSKTVDCSS